MNLRHYRVSLYTCTPSQILQRKDQTSRPGYQRSLVFQLIALHVNTELSKLINLSSWTYTTKAESACVPDTPGLTMCSDNLGAVVR